MINSLEPVNFLCRKRNVICIQEKENDPIIDEIIERISRFILADVNGGKK